MANQDRREPSPPSKRDIARLFLEREASLLRVEKILAANRADMMSLLLLAQDFGGNVDPLKIRQRNERFTDRAAELLDERIQEGLGLVGDKEKEDYRSFGLRVGLRFWEKQLVRPGADTLTVSLGQRRSAIIRAQLSPPQPEPPQ